MCGRNRKVERAVIAPLSREAREAEASSAGVEPTNSLSLRSHHSLMPWVRPPPWQAEAEKLAEALAKAEYLAEYLNNELACPWTVERKAERKATEMKEKGDEFDEEAFEAEWLKEVKADAEFQWECDSELLRDSYGTDYLSSTSDKEEKEEEMRMLSEPAPAGTPLFHIDAAGKTCFNEVEARAASELVAGMKLDERIAAAMKHADFIFPQRNVHMYQGHLCNSEWNGDFSLLQVTGVVRLEAAPELVGAAFAAEAAERKEKIAEYIRRKEDYAEKRKQEDRAMESAMKPPQETESEENFSPQKKAKTSTAGCNVA